MDRAGYGRLCRLLTLGKAYAGKGGCTLAWDDVVAHGAGLIAILVPDRPDARCAEPQVVFGVGPGCQNIREERRTQNKRNEMIVIGVGGRRHREQAEQAVGGSNEVGVNR